MSATLVARGLAAGHGARVLFSGLDLVVAAGDSLLDADLLEEAHAGIAARHGELVASGWQMAHVSVTEHSGVRAGAEIVDWFHARVGAWAEESGRAG